MVSFLIVSISQFSHLFPLAQSASVFNSALTLLAISVDRYYSVCRHEKSPYRMFNLTVKVDLMISKGMEEGNNLQTCAALIVSIWAVSFTLALPYSLNMEVVERECGMRCIENWRETNILNSMEVKILYGFVAMIIQVWIVFGGFLSYKSL